jgi:hypothetical protein
MKNKEGNPEKILIGGVVDLDLHSLFPQFFQELWEESRDREISSRSTIKDRE